MSTRNTRPEPRPASRSMNEALRGPLIALVVVIAVAVVALVLRGGGDDDADGGSPVADVQMPEDGADADPLDALARRLPDDPQALGDVDAPVVMVMWEEFQCPFCGRFSRESKPELTDRYVADGTLRLEWRDFPYLGEASEVAARAARAAGEQGAFWEFHDALFALELTPRSGQLTTDLLLGIADDLGLDHERFTATMESPEVAEAVAADFAEGQGLGVQGTPAFVVNGRPIIGAQPLDVFVDAVEEAAAAAGGGAGG